MSVIRWSICPGQAYPAWSKVKNRAITYPSEAFFRCSNAGWATGLTPTNIGLGLKGLPGTSTQAYYENYGCKKFYNIDACGQCYKTFYGHKIRIFVIS